MTKEAVVKMLNETDIGEIRTQYKQAKKPEAQIGILADLYGVSKDEIRMTVGAPITGTVRPKAEHCNEKAYFKWDKQLTERLVNLIDLGKTPSQMAAELGVPVDKVRSKLKYLGANYQKDTPAPTVRPSPAAMPKITEAAVSNTTADSQTVGYSFNWISRLENIESSVLECFDALNLTHDAVSRLVSTLERHTEDELAKLICGELSTYMSVFNLALNRLHEQKQPIADLRDAMFAALRKEKKNAKN